MHFRIILSAQRFFSFLIVFISFAYISFADTKSWTGFGGDSDWSNPINWSNGSLPLPTDDVLLDNTSLPVSYQIYLPDIVVVLKTLHIIPSPGRNIELILPNTNVSLDALTVTGPGYGIELNAGAIFRNASGLSSGESLMIADSIMIHDGGRYIHQTRAAHANGILKLLSIAPGTEQGVFDFDVPRSSYTISVSNRIYGSLELHATALGGAVNYTGTGANSLIVRGNLRIGTNVSMSMDLSGSNGNIFIYGDFIQEGGQLNLATGVGDNTVCRINGDVYQSANATITESNGGNPVLELNGNRSQAVAMAGKITNQVGFRINNLAGSVLNVPLTLPWLLILEKGTLYSSATALLSLDVNCNVETDSSASPGSYVDGPLCKLGLAGQDHFLFPVGKDGNIRWIELKTAIGDFTVEYIHQNPNMIGTAIGPGLNHLSELEYWTIIKNGVKDSQSKIELSFSSAQSGGVTDPNYLNVAEFQSGEWEDAGHGGITGNSIRGSVLSSETDFSAIQYTLASTVNFENPLPNITIDLQVTEPAEKILFNWTFAGPVIPDHFNLYEISDSSAALLTTVPAIENQREYTWNCAPSFEKGTHYFRVAIVDATGKAYLGKIVLFRENGQNPELSWVSSGVSDIYGKLSITTEVPDEWSFEILTVEGRVIKKGVLNLGRGKNFLDPQLESFSSGVYIFRALDSSGKSHSLLFRK
ncbi:MAG TPA: hypothetical protein VK772_08440 [Puia sp.]|jgi:hypothetical protein|nr:hypothetical protein [Puia sp.]